MRDGSVARPTGFDAEATFHQHTHERLGPQSELRSSSTVAVTKTTRGIRLRAKGRTGKGRAGMVYKGTYDPTKSYAVQDVVRDGVGIWVCVKAQPPHGEVPVYPEPADTASGENNWELLSFRVVNYHFKDPNCVRYRMWINAAPPTPDV